MKLTIVPNYTSPQEPEVKFELVSQDDGSLRLYGYNDLYAGMVLLTIDTDGKVKTVPNGFSPLGLRFEG